MTVYNGRMYCSGKDSTKKFYEYAEERRWCYLCLLKENCRGDKWLNGYAVSGKVLLLGGETNAD